MHRQSASLIALMLLAFTASATAAPMETYSDGNSGRMYAIRVTPQALNGQSASSATTPAALKATADGFINDNLQLIGIADPAVELLAAAPETDRLGLSRVHYFQRWHGLDVLGGEITVHLNTDGQVYYVKTKVAKGLPVDTTPSFTEVAAQSAAVHLAHDDTQNAVTPTVAKSRLIVLPLGILKNDPSTTSYLAWEITVVDDETDGEHWGETYFYDAHSGAPVFQLPLQAHYTAVTREVYDCASGASANICAINQADPAFPTYIHGRTEGDPARGPFPNPAFPLFFGSSEVDSLYGYLKSIHDYYSTTFGIDGANGHGGLADWPSVPQNISRGVAHNDGYAGECSGGAVFSQSTGTIFFCRYMVVPDVVAHEYSHGIVHHSFHDGSGYPIGDVYYGQTAALDEGYADFMGQCFEKSYTGVTDWINGAGTEYNHRSLANPHSFLRSGFDNELYPDRFYDPNFYCGSGDFQGAHANLTVPAHAMYLFSEGGDFNGCTVAGQGMDATQQVLFRGWRNYFSQSESFQEAYSDLIQACTDLYPASTVVELTKALQAAEMDQPGLCSGIPAQTPACAGASAVNDDLASATDGSSIRFCGPNPSFGPATIEYALGRAGQVEVSVYDLAGHLVAKVASEWQDHGVHQATWSDRRVPSGFYVMRVAIDGETIGTRKLMVVR
jgi:Zn-dependent metalloprotease